MTDLEALKAQISDEADLCRNEGATDIASLLDDTRYTIETQAREIERLRGLLREAEVKLTDVQGAYATRQYSANLLIRIRAALAGDSHD